MPTRSSKISQGKTKRALRLKKQHSGSDLGGSLLSACEAWVHQSQCTDSSKYWYDFPMAFYSALDRSIFEFALTRLEQRKAELDAQIGSIFRQLGRTVTPVPGSDSSPAAAVDQAARKRRRKPGMSAEGKARVAAAQRKRWAALKKRKARASK
jgi:hypothetical protein